ncbi:TetR/AcrR family transcriptional regulator [Dietzia aerolata]|uniref:TetR/AcrR family transcriptional regulator n=1 Tax=Dietzia aerolata TaxID=595984 RepID=A0ABV5JRM2_9ACTN|nr:TetR/AcrR family transcriptional regulator [Dietzia aerolata]
MRSREPILEATREVIGDAGFDGVTIAAVAKRAGVSRQTVYSIFGTREELVSQAVTERLTSLFGAVSELQSSSTTPLELLVEILVVSRGHILGDPLLRTLTLAGGSSPIFDPGAAERARDYVRSLLVPATEQFPELTPHLDFISDVGVHMGWSMLCLDSPESRSDAELRAFLVPWLGPLVASLLG